ASLFEPRLDAFGDVVGSDGDLEFVLEAVAGGLGDLHVSTRLYPRAPDGARSAWCGRRDLNPHDLRRWNLNPVRLPIPPRPRAAKPAGKARFIAQGMCKGNSARRERMPQGTALNVEMSLVSVRHALAPIRPPRRRCDHHRSKRRCLRRRSAD